MALLVEEDLEDLDTGLEMESGFIKLLSGSSKYFVVLIADKGKGFLQTG